MGARIQICNKEAIVEGNPDLHGATLEAKDLRGGAALTVAALGAKGESKIRGLQFIDRGYEQMEADLGLLGANIVRMGSEKKSDTMAGRNFANAAEEPLASRLTVHVQ